MRQEVSQPQSRFSAMTREQMAVCGNNNPDQKEREAEDSENSPLQLILLHRLPFHVVTLNIHSLKTKKNKINPKTFLSFFLNYLTQIQFKHLALWCTSSTYTRILFMLLCVSESVHAHNTWWHSAKLWQIIQWLGEFSNSCGYFVYECMQVCICHRTNWK